MININEQNLRQQGSRFNQLQKLDLSSYARCQTMPPPPSALRDFEIILIPKNVGKLNCRTNTKVEKSPFELAKIIPLIGYVYTLDWQNMHGIFE